MDATTTEQHEGPTTRRSDHGPSPPAAERTSFVTPNAPAASMHAHPQTWGSPPYRRPEAWTAMPMPRPPPKPAPFRVRELLAVVGLVVAADVALFSSKGAASGGFGLGVLFVVLPVAIAIAARAKRVSRSIGV